LQIFLIKNCCYYNPFFKLILSNCTAHYIFNLSYIFNELFNDPSITHHTLSLIGINFNLVLFFNNNIGHYLLLTKDTSHIPYNVMVSIHRKLDHDFKLPWLPNFHNHWSVFNLYNPTSSSNIQLVCISFVLFQFKYPYLVSIYHNWTL